MLKYVALSLGIVVKLEFDILTVFSIYIQSVVDVVVRHGRSSRFAVLEHKSLNDDGCLLVVG